MTSLLTRAHRSMIGGHHMLGAIVIGKNVRFMSPTTEGFNLQEGLRVSENGSNNLGYDPLAIGSWLEEPGLIVPSEPLQREQIYPAPQELFVVISSSASTTNAVEGRDQYVDMTVYETDDPTDEDTFTRVPRLPWRRFIRPFDLGDRAEGHWSCVFEVGYSTKRYGVIGLRTSLIPTKEEMESGTTPPDPGTFLCFGGFYFFSIRS